MGVMIQDQRLHASELLQMGQLVRVPGQRVYDHTVPAGTGDLASAVSAARHLHRRYIPDRGSRHRHRGSLARG